MLSFVRPLMNEEVKHLLAPKRDIFGQPGASYEATTHVARVVFVAGKILAPASRENMPDAKAVVWLINHPRPIEIGNLFELPDGQTLAVSSAERRSSGSDTLHKVYLS